MSDSPKRGDILGIGSLSETLTPITKGLVDGAAAFLGRICLPAAEEFGLMLRDRVGLWRAHNASSVVNQAKALLTDSDGQAVHAPPRLVAQIVEHGSWADDRDLQTMWGGLLASACSSDGKDDSNVIFVDLLARLTSSEARLLRFLGTKSDIRVSEVGWLHAYSLSLELVKLLEVAGVADAQRLDREIEHLRHLGLLDGGFERGSLEALLTMTPLGLQMFARCEGCRVEPAVFLRAKPAPPATTNEPEPPRSSRRRRQSGCVLVVDDEPSIVKGLSMSLSRAGFDVATATSGDAALQVVRQQHIDVLLTDLNMPDMRGDVVFEVACGHQPTLRTRTLFITGDISERAQKLIAACKCPFLRKPFDLRDLVDAVSAMTEAQHA